MDQSKQKNNSYERHLKQQNKVMSISLTKQNLNMQRYIITLDNSVLIIVAIHAHFAAIRMFLFR